MFPLAGQKDLDDCSMMEDVEPFEGSYTFPEEKSQETNDFIDIILKRSIQNVM